jgi:hypothetical protein
MNRSRVLRTDRGTAQIELLLSILSVLFVMFWTWEVVMAVYTYAVLSDAAREGVRYAIVHGSKNSNCSGTVPSGTACPDPSASNVVAIVRDYASYSFHDISSMNISVTYPDTYNASPNRVQVAITYNYIPYTSFPFHPRLKATAQGRIAH